ncbi:response regulator [Uliginosibacterium sp. TH139]|uniref:response regulator n=1 Tax=Uliginosibacterium sp. TH139 TaxID=2067453 RepID=UPI000C7C4A4A|nr:response regulator [Uliginosibacterium sp. TH139]PLK48803.1 response regulator [Uliginosibacterium sp. TH139]
MSQILILDDEPAILQSLRRMLRVAPCVYGSQHFDLQIETFVSARAALERARHEPFDLFLTDYRMPEMDGVSFLKAAKEAQPDACRLILSGYADLNALTRAVNEVGIDRFIGKPWNDYELVSAIAQALAHRELLLENRRLADLMRVDIGDLSPADLEARRLEAIEPGITRVSWAADGSVILEPDPESEAPAGPVT